MKKIIFTIWALMVFAVLISQTSMAAIAADKAPADKAVIDGKFNVGILSPDGETPKYLGDEEPLVKVILDTIDKAILIIGSVAILAIVIGGVFMIISSGNDTLLQRGKTIFLYAIIGLLVAFTSYIITSFVQSLFF